MKIKTGKCTYCGKVGTTTVDHIPPKALFTKPRTPKLITIPSCYDCNGGRNLDDEYFKYMLVLNDHAYGNPAINHLLSDIIRGFKRPDKQNFRRRFFETTKPVNYMTKAGIYLGKALSYKVDLNRIDRVCEYIIRGLYFNETGQTILKNDVEVSVFWETNMGKLDEDTKSIIASVLRTEEKIIDPNIFSYRFQCDPNMPVSSVWILEFYNSIRVMALTLPLESTRTIYRNNA